MHAHNDWLNMTNLKLIFKVVVVRLLQSLQLSCKFVTWYLSLSACYFLQYSIMNEYVLTLNGKCYM